MIIDHCLYDKIIDYQLTYDIKIIRNDILVESNETLKYIKFRYFSDIILNKEKKLIN